MAVIVWPVDAVTGAPSYTGRLARQTMAPLLAGATAARPLGARSGVRPGTSATTVTATSTTWSMDLHAGILDLEASGLVGPYAYAVNTAQTGAVTAADATRPRIDIVWVRLDDPAESDGSSVPAVVAGYTAGAPLASPVAPATPARCMVLATLQVPMSGGGSPTVIWVAPYTVAAGAQVPVWSQAERDAIALRDGLHVYRLDTHTPEFYNGTAWSTPGVPQVATLAARNALTAYDGLQVYRLDLHRAERFNGTAWKTATPVGGVLTTNSDSNGYIVQIPHGLGYVPTWAVATPIGSSLAGGNDAVAAVAKIHLHFWDATYITFRVVRVDTNINFNTPIAITWSAM